MTKLKDEHMVYLSDEMYTPIHYKGIMVQQPFFEGKGNHSVAKLEEICEQFQEYIHQQQIIKQNCMKHIVELKFGVEVPKEDELDDDIIFVGTGGVTIFNGTRLEFEETKIFEATNEAIKDWCYDFGYELKINDEVIFSNFKINGTKK